MSTSRPQQVDELGGYLCGRRLSGTMLVRGTDPSLRAGQLRAAFADVRCALPKVVFGRTLDSVRGNAEASVAAAIEEGLVDEQRTFRNPVVVGDGTPFLAPVTAHVPLELIETRTFSARVVYERYGRAATSRNDTAVVVLRIPPCPSRSGTSSGTSRTSGPTSTARRTSSSAWRPGRSSSSDPV